MDEQQKIFFNNATTQLLNSLKEMKLPPQQLELAMHYTCLFRTSFNNPNTRLKTFIDENINFKYLRYDADGFCRAASKAFATLMTLYTKTLDWQVMYIDNTWSYGPHHFIKHMPSGINFDLTYDQYSIQNIFIPYNLGQEVCMLSGDKSPLRFALANGIDLINIMKGNEKL